jgi:hypothetical protein
MAHKGAAFAQAHRFAIGAVRQVGKLAAQGSVGKQVADAAFNIDPAIGARGTGVVRDLVKFFFVLQQVQCQRL